MKAMLEKLKQLKSPFRRHLDMEHFKGIIVQIIKAPFKFYIKWVNHSQFMPIVNAHWRASEAKGRMKAMLEKLKQLNSQFRRHLNYKHFKGIIEKIDKTRLHVA